MMDNNIVFLGRPAQTIEGIEQNKKVLNIFAELLTHNERQNVHEVLENYLFDNFKPKKAKKYKDKKCLLRYREYSFLAPYGLNVANSIYPAGKNVEANSSYYNILYIKPAEHKKVLDPLCDKLDILDTKNENIINTLSNVLESVNTINDLEKIGLKTVFVNGLQLKTIVDIDAEDLPEYKIMELLKNKKCKKIIKEVNKKALIKQMHKQQP